MAAPYPFRVLVADDEPVNRKLLVSVLGKLVDGVDEARDGFEALDRLEASPFDVLITDLSMPRLDGLSLIRELRLRHHTLPIVVLSAHHEHDLLERARELGATAFLPKPVRVSALQEALAAVAEARGH